MTVSDVIIDRLMARHPKGFDLSLGRVERLLHALGDPHLRLPPVIHVAGTNGKGSTVAFMRAILEASGRRVHTHTSPHLVRFNERYRMATRPGRSAFVDDARFADALMRAEAANADQPITVFEILTAAGFLLFSESPADIALIEVGLGGRFDATNVIPSPLVAVITQIGLDHEAYLGDRVEKIAFEKAGIMKPGRPVVVSPPTDEVRAVFEAEAARVGASLIVGGQDFAAHEEHGRLVYQDGGGLMDLPPPRLPGRHQFSNAATAVAALRASGLSLGLADYQRGMQEVEWPARLQRLLSGRLLDAAPAGAEIWLDGGHNPNAGEALATAMAEIEERAPRPLFLVVGMLKTKDPIGFFRPFQGLAKHVFAVPIPQSDAAREPEELAAAARSAGLFAEKSANVAAAIRNITWISRGSAFPPRILICGSLYLAGEVLAENGTPPA